MAFNWHGGGRSPFSPSTTQSWTTTTGPSFGAQQSTPIFATTGTVFQSSSAFGRPSTGGFFFGGASSTAPLFGAQSSTSLFAPSTTAPQPRPLAQPTSAFRTEFYRAVKRKDGRPVTYHTRLDELDDDGQRAVRMIMDEQEQYKAIWAEVSKNPLFQKDANRDALEERFHRDVESVRELMSEHRLDIEDVRRDLRPLMRRWERFEQAFREAELLIADLTSVQNPRTTGTAYQQQMQEMQVPHVFVVEKAAELQPRLETLLEMVEEMEKISGRPNLPTAAADEKTETQIFEMVHRLSKACYERVKELHKKIEDRKEIFVAEHRHEGVTWDVFKDPVEERILENDLRDDWERHRVHLVQPLQAPPSQPAPAIGFGQSFVSAPASSTSIFGAAASSGSIFGGPVSSGGMFGPAASSSGVFGGMASPSQTTGFGAGVFGGGSPNTLFPQGGFGAASSGGFSPSSVGTNVGTSPGRLGNQGTRSA